MPTDVDETLKRLHTLCLCISEAHTLNVEVRTIIKEHDAAVRADERETCEFRLCHFESALALKGQTMKTQELIDFVMMKGKYAVRQEVSDGD